VRKKGQFALIPSNYGQRPRGENCRQKSDMLPMFPGLTPPLDLGRSWPHDRVRKTSARGNGKAKLPVLTSTDLCSTPRQEETMAGNGQKVIDLDRQRMSAMAQKDIAALNKLISDDLVYTHSSARLDTKESLIGAMEAGRTVYTAVVPSDVKAQDLGDTVVLTGNARISVNSGGNAMNFGVRFTDVWVNKSGQWQMVAWQSTRTPD
jgi:ketosteroid isomerase-like protein